MNRNHAWVLASVLGAVLFFDGAARASETTAPSKPAPKPAPKAAPQATGQATGAVEVKGATPAPASPSAGPQPKLEMGDTTFNAGETPKGEPLVHEYAVKNVGKADLQVLSVKPSCGCTVPDWTKIIAPGQSGSITLKVDTSRFKGPISKTATVETNDPDSASFRLTLNANVTTFIDVTPDTVAFRQYRGGEDKKEQVTIHSNEKGEFTIKDVQVTGEGIKHEIAKKTDGSGDYTLTLWLDKTAPIGSVSGSAKLTTSSPKEPEITVTVRGVVMGQVNVNPSSLYFRVDTGTEHYTTANDNVNVRELGDPGAKVVAKLAKDTKLTVVDTAGDWLKVRTPTSIEGWVSKKLVAPAKTDAADQSKVLNVSHRQSTAFQITGTQVEGPKLDAKMLKVATEPVQAGQSYKVTVTYGGKLEKGNYTGSLVLKTSDKDEPEIKVPVYIVVT